MSTNLIAGIVFVAVFGLVILIHELGHFIVGRMMKVEVEEFGFGIPPRMWRFWWGKGLLIFNGQRIQIPRNFNVDFNWREVRNLPTKITVNHVNDNLVLQTIEISMDKDVPETSTKDHILVDQSGKSVEPQQKKITERISCGDEAGEVELYGGITEVYPGTQFTLNWLPFGGFNRFKGEDSLEEGYVPELGSLPAASPWARFAILIAGATMNLILGIFVYQLIFSQIGIPNLEQVQIYDVTPGSPAEEAGFRTNDILLEMNGETITSDTQMRALTQENLDQNVEITLLRDGEEIKTTGMPLSTRSAEEGAFGFMPGYAYNESPSFGQAFIYGIEMTGYHAREILLLPGRMIQGSVSPEEGRFIGFKGIFDIFKQSVSADMESRADSPAPTTSSAPIPQEQSPTFFTLSMIANLTITLGVFNLLPLPALDGGRIIFLLPELLFRKRVSPRVEGMIHWAGFMLLLGLMFYINIMDFVDPVSITFP
mgnify:CR=1 FL=1